MLVKYRSLSVSFKYDLNICDPIKMKDAAIIR
jgi:hypothetical protein